MNQTNELDLIWIINVLWRRKWLIISLVLLALVVSIVVLNNLPPVYDYMVSMGIYVFEPAVLAYIPKGKYLDFPDLIKILIAAGERVVGYPFEGYWQDLGRPDDYENATLDFEHMKSQFLPEVNYELENSVS